MENNNLTKSDIERYCRQIILPEIKTIGQEKLKNAKVLVVGAGGLGSPCLMYLAGAGIGVIGVVDGDSVDPSNLHRQIIHSTNNTGLNKARSAEMLIKSFNPNIKVNVYEEHFTNSNCLTIANGYDLIVDCCDNPSTRYLTSDVCVVLNIPLVSGAAVKWEGQLTVYVKDNLTKESNKLPCYRCLFPIPTPASSVCACSDSGVFGPVPGVIGTLQANEVVKLILGANDKILSKRMLTYDAYEMAFKIFKMRNNKDDCIACGKDEVKKISLSNIETYDYNEFTNPKECRIEKRLKLEENKNINWINFLNFIQNKTNLVLIDVRPKEQYDMFSLKLSNNLQFKNIPYSDLVTNYADYEESLKKSGSEIYVTCRAGNQSTHAVKFLSDKGLINVFNIIDGIHGYIKEIDNINIPYY